MTVTAQQLRHYGSMVLELAAEMEVDGANPALVERLHADGATCFIEAVKAERKAEAASWSWVPNTAATIPDLALIAAGYTSTRYQASGEIIGGVETRTGRYDCCGAQAYIGEDRAGPHFDYCPRYGAGVKAGDSASLVAHFQ